MNMPRFDWAACDASSFLIVALPAKISISLTGQRAFAICGRTWAIWALVWLLMAFFSKSNKRRETPGQRLEHIIPAMIGFLLIFREDFGWPLLTRVIFPDNPALMLACVVVTIVGLLFAVGARLALG